MDKEEDLRKGEKCAGKYRETGDFGHIIHLITNDTPFYEIIRKDEIVFSELYKHFLGYDKHDLQKDMLILCHISLEKSFSRMNGLFDVQSACWKCVTSQRHLVAEKRLTSIVHNKVMFLVVLNVFFSTSKLTKNVLLRWTFIHSPFNHHRTRESNGMYTELTQRIEQSPVRTQIV
jgi:hypothetical protein